MALSALLLSGSNRAAAQCQPQLRRGDSNADGRVDLSDGISTLGYLFLGNSTPGCLDAADANDSGALDLTDGVYIFLYLFAGGPAPPKPGPLECGADPTEDRLDCRSGAPCQPPPPAEEVCDGIDNDCDGTIDCPPGSYCAAAAGDCGGPAACKEKPLSCPEVLKPVCGCDGVTYENECEAARAGANVLHEGECPPGGCSESGECPPGFFCARAPGDCAAGGSCAERPADCPDVLHPVCGCDGASYGNACDAAAAGVSVAHDGECGTVVCSGNGDCPGDFFCARAPGDCAGSGTCQRRPRACPLIFRPVCGCDGLSYGNACEAAGAGVSVAYEGQCGFPRCQENDHCEPDSFCAREAGDCLGSGVCAGVPVDCPDVIEPVCGCDGVTYQNACVAAISLVNVQYAGECVAE